MRAQREVVVLVPREARQIEDDDELDPALVRAAVLAGASGARSGQRFHTLAFLAESREHVDALALAVRLTRLELGRQTQVLGLLLRADANVDDRADHLWKLSAVIGRRQGTSSRHGS